MMLEWLFEDMLESSEKLYRVTDNLIVRRMNYQPTNIALPNYGEGRE
jgi:hypothetical protein